MTTVALNETLTVGLLKDLQKTFIMAQCDQLMWLMLIYIFVFVLPGLFLLKLKEYGIISSLDILNYLGPLGMLLFIYSLLIIPLGFLNVMTTTSHILDLMELILRRWVHGHG